MHFKEPTIRGEPVPPIARHTATVVGNRVFIIGGYGSTYFHDLSMLDMSMRHALPPRPSPFALQSLSYALSLSLFDVLLRSHDDVEHSRDQGQAAPPPIKPRRRGHRHQDLRVWRLHG